MSSFCQYLLKRTCPTYLEWKTYVILLPTTFLTLEIYEEEVAFQIEKLLANKSPGPDGLYPVHLKMLKDELVKPLTMIFNKSLQEGIVPKDFRMANITPIFKKGDRKMPNNYRPIS